MEVKILRSTDRKVMAQKKIDHLDEFTISADLLAGHYRIESVPQDSEISRYWKVLGPMFEVGKSGVLAIRSNDFKELLHQRKIKLVSPLTVELDNNDPPMLEWEPIEGATGYRVQCLIHYSPDRPAESLFSVRVVQETKIIFPEVIKEGCLYEWSVHAEQGGMHIGYYSAAYIYAKGAKEKFAGRFNLPKSGSFLGVELGGRLKEWNQGGIMVMRVLPDSPAAKAGLNVGDIILEANGQSLEDLSTTGAGRLIRSLPTAKPVEFKIKRDGEVLKVLVYLSAI